MPSFVGILEGINIRLLRPVVVTVEHQEDSQAENNESKDKEEPEEILHIVSEVGSVVGHRDRYLDSLFRVDEPFPRDFYSIKTGRYVYLYQQESIPTHNRFGAKSATNLVQDDIPNSQNTFPTIYGLCILTANIPFLGVYPMRL